MHKIKAMRTAEETLVFQIPENIPPFPYPHQRLSLVFFSFPVRGTLSKFSTSCRFLCRSFELGVIGAPRCHRTDDPIFSTRVVCEAASETPRTRFLKIRDLSLVGDTLCYP